MKRFFLLIPFLTVFFISYSQDKTRNKKYPSLLWEISGKGLTKPSYLFGTMHVSSKIAFHLSDSFYVALKNADIVALENNPESWQEDMNKYDDYLMNTDPFSEQSPEDYLTIQSLRIEKYESKLEMALFMKPAVINNLLYRSNTESGSDFEEDTYLDLYIYQAGKKLGKRVAGVEQYEESIRLMNEAFKDAAKEKNKKEKSFDIDEEFSPDKLQEAYRAGDLDLLDSINRLNSQSEAFDEKYLYKRNEIQANSIDSILRKFSLFVGVGAAHLPGNRGVIELLRKKGYRLRPVFMGTRDSRYKDAIEKIRVPVNFITQTSDDGFFKVDVPGRLYQYESGLTDQRQFADMANGSFYMITRVITNSLFWGHSVNQVTKKIDSILYENIPGKILSKKEITRNGYSGFDITNRTRRGDYQRYHIFITPFEVLFFKMSGNGDYVKNSQESNRFFSSIQLKEFKNADWKSFQPAFGGFSIEMPQEPFEQISEGVKYDAEEKATGNHFAVLRTDIHNYNFAEEDSFDLNLMDESFASSEFINKRAGKKLLVYQGYPALDCRYEHKDGSIILTRFIIRGPHYYSLISHGPAESKSMQKFLNSFEIIPFVYEAAVERKDTVLNYSVITPWFTDEKKEKSALESELTFEKNEDNFPDKDVYKSRVIKNDTTGEAIYISYYKTPKYFYSKDSSLADDNNGRFSGDGDSSWIIRSSLESDWPDKTRVFEIMASGINSSRVIWSKTFYKNGNLFVLTTETDTLSSSGNFISNFYKSFKPSNALPGINPFIRKSKIYFDDLFSRDSILRNSAIRSVHQADLDSSDLHLLDKAIHSFNWSDKNYLTGKISFINKLGEINTRESSNLLKEIFYAAGDTIRIQNAALEALLKHRTKYAFDLFGDIITKEPPVLDHAETEFWLNEAHLKRENKKDERREINNGNFLDELYDSLLLTHTILPGLLSLIELDDYKWPVMRLLRAMLDSNLIKPKEYEAYFTKFLMEAKQAIKKQVIEEKKSGIEKAEGEKNAVKPYGFYNMDEPDKGNENLVVYATLLLPFQHSHPAVEVFINQLLSSGDKRLKYNTFHLLLRNKKPLPDSLLNYFAARDEYRFELYSDLHQMKLLHRFPSAYNNYRDLARGRLCSLSKGVRPDSLLFLDSLPLNYKNKNGLMFFYKYKMKMDDSYWKLATSGIVPDAATGFVFGMEKFTGGGSPVMPVLPSDPYLNPQYGFTSFTEVKIKEDENLREQVSKQLKKIHYSNRKSGRYFYIERADDSYFMRGSQ